MKRKIIPFLKKPQRVVNKSQSQIIKENRDKRAARLIEFARERDNEK
ncbi:MAG: hypothetical protein ACE3L7_14615 [Candidatus Pristimantibacillus sp.]